MGRVAAAAEASGSPLQLHLAVKGALAFLRRVGGRKNVFSHFSLRICGCKFTRTPQSWKEKQVENRAELWCSHSWSESTNIWMSQTKI